MSRYTYGEMIQALADECAALQSLIDALPDDQWRRPTRLPGWDALILVTHTVHASAMLAELAAAPSSEPPKLDRGNYYRYDVAKSAPEVDARARAAAQGQTPASLRRQLAAATVDALAAARSALPSVVLPHRRGAIRLDHFLATRVLEACIHTLDLRAAVGAPLTATPLGLGVTADLLEEMLGVSRPPDLADDVAFVEAGTGRRPHPDRRFPILQ